MQVFKSWKTTRLVSLAIIAFAVASLFPILDSILGITLADKVFGFDFQYIIGTLLAFVWYIIWKFT